MNVNYPFAIVWLAWWSLGNFKLVKLKVERVNFTVSLIEFSPPKLNFD
jgi:hypothetical protein